MNRPNLKDKKVGRWEVQEYIGEVDTPGGRKYHVWKCKCACGHIRQIREGNLLQEKSTQCKSCGARQSRKQHGHSTTKRRTFVYNKWMRIKHSNVPVCEEWKNFNVFLHDITRKPIGKRPNKDHELVRINAAEGWKPSNVVWKERKKNVKKYEYQGIEYSIGELAFLANMNRRTMQNRLENYPVDIAMEAPVKKYNRRVKCSDSENS